MDSLSVLEVGVALTKVGRVLKYLCLNNVPVHSIIVLLLATTLFEEHKDSPQMRGDLHFEHHSDSTPVHVGYILQMLHIEREVQNTTTKRN